MTATADAPAARRPPLTVLSGAVAVVLALVIGLAAALVVKRSSPTYLANAGTLLDEPKAVAVSTDAGVIDKLSRLRFKYSGILRSDTVVDAVAKKTGISRSDAADALASRADPNSLLLVVGARADSEKKAVRLANAFADELSSYVATEQKTNRIPPLLTLELRVVAPARDASQLTPTQRQEEVAGAAAFLATLVVVVGVAEAARRRSA